jgi:hypothetical protein
MSSGRCLSPFNVGTLLMISGAITFGSGFRKPHSSPLILTSIPLCPTSSSPVADYIGAPLSPVCFPSDQYNVSVSLRLSDIGSPENEQSGYIVHNLWGYRFTLSICESPTSCDGGISGSFSHNIEIGDPGLTKDPSFTLDTFSVDNLIGNRPVFFCPLPTLITKYLGIDPYCAEPQGYRGTLEGEFQYFEAVNVTYQSISSTEVWLVFQELEAFPQTYHELPQMYWMSWAANHLTVMIVGGAISGCGLLVLGVDFFVKKVLPVL